MLERFWTFAQETTAKLHGLAANRVRAAPVPPRAEPPLLTIEEGWERATGAVTAAISGSGRMQALHAAAASQIEAADYTLQHLLGELSIAIPRPADGSALRALLATVAEREQAAEETLAA
jgi:hypothetical protein